MIGTEKTLEYEGNGDTNYNLCTWNDKKIHFYVNQTPVRNHQLMLVWKSLKRVKE